MQSLYHTNDSCAATELYIVNLHAYVTSATTHIKPCGLLRASRSRNPQHVFAFSAGCRRPMLIHVSVARACTTLNASVQFVYALRPGFIQ
jgi:hypothetical protein